MEQRGKENTKTNLCTLKPIAHGNRGKQRQEAEKSLKSGEERLIKLFNLVLRCQSIKQQV